MTIKMQMLILSERKFIYFGAVDKLCIAFWFPTASKGTSQRLPNELQCLTSAKKIFMLFV
jgi:hypothetical protein